MKSHAAVLGLLLCMALPLHAQDRPREGAQTFLVSRAELERRLAEYEAAAANSSARAAARQTAQQEAERIRQRLEEGDFRTGDQIVLYVAFEPTLSDTFAVSPIRELELPGLAPISLAGVLRAELNEHLTREIGRFVREPQVRATSLLRVTVLGEVSRPGFYLVTSHTPLSELLTIAGGPNRTAALDRIRIERNNRPIWEPDEVQTALVEGSTLDQLSLQAGDRIVVPETRSRTHALRWALATIPPLVWLVVSVARM